MDTLTFYVVRSKDGKYLRSTGYGGGGVHWVEDIKKAKVWNKIGPAHSQVTWWTNNYPEFGVPAVIPFIATPGEPIDQTDRVKKAQRAKQLKELSNDLWRAQRDVDSASSAMDIQKGKGWRYEQAKEQYDKVFKKLENIKQKQAELKANK